MAMNYKQINANNKNYVVNWAASDQTAISANTISSLNNGVPLQLDNGYAVTNLKTGITAWQYDMPFGNVRYIVVDTSTTGIDFTINGEDQNGSFQTETFTSNGFAYTSINLYTRILSIIPSSISGTTTVDIGIDNGFTTPFVADVFNGVSNYSIAFSNVDDISITLRYSLDGITYFPFNITQPPFVVSPSGFDNPITENGIISFDNIPFQYITADVANSETGTFTLTIMQQGARF